MKTKDGKERRTKTAPAGWRRRLSFAVGGLLSFFLIGLSVLSAAENGNVAEKMLPAFLNSSLQELQNKVVCKG